MSQKTLEGKTDCRKGAATVIGDQTYYHCPDGRHKPEEIQRAIEKVPVFMAAGKGGE